MEKISVITINLNNATGLKKTIASVAAQQECAVELIVIDGGSTDESVGVIRHFAQNITYWVSEKDKGIYHAQNKGILKATGSYCLFLNSGDVLAGTAVLKKMSAAADNKGIVYGDLITVDKNGKRNNLKSPDTADIAFFMVSTLWHPTALIRRELFDNFGLYNDTFKITGDYEFFIRAVLRFNASTKHVSLPVCIFDLGGISNSPSMQGQEQAERKKSWELNFSQAAIQSFETHTRLVRSREYKLGQLIKKILKPFSR